MLIVPKAETPNYYPTIITAVLAFVPATLVALFTWARDLNSQARRIRNIDEAKKLVDFWDAYMSAIKTADEHALPEIKLELQLAASRIGAKEQRGQSDYFYARWKRLSRLRQWLFVFKPPTSYIFATQAIFYGGLVTVLLELYFLSRRNHSKGSLSFPHTREGVLMMLGTIVAATSYWVLGQNMVTRARESSEVEEGIHKLTARFNRANEVMQERSKAREAKSQVQQNESKPDHQ